jgi:predicted methyltransferase
MRNSWIAFIALACTAATSAQSPADSPSSIAVKIRAAMDSSIRNSTEKERDANRLPVETLEFFRLRDDMRVVELAPQEGWYTKILGPVLAQHGHLYVTLGGTRGVEPLLAQYPSLGGVEILALNAKMVPNTESGIADGYFDISAFQVPTENIDLVVTFRNYHNFTPAARAHINQAVFKVLRPGGMYGVLDHTRRHNEPTTLENWRRMDPVLVIKEIQDAGFRLVDSSNIHYTPDDELRYEVGRKSVKGNSDRFTLLFQKPD